MTSDKAYELEARLNNIITNLLPQSAVTNGQNTTSTTAVPITGLSGIVEVQSGSTYLVELWLLFSSPAAAGTATFALTEPATSAAEWGYTITTPASGSEVSGALSDPPSVTSPAMLASPQQQLVLRGTVTYSASGLLTVTMKTSSASDQLNVAGGYLLVTP